jgi:hypothetical protein
MTATATRQRLQPAPRAKTTGKAAKLPPIPPVLPKRIGGMGMAAIAKPGVRCVWREGPTDPDGWRECGSKAIWRFAVAGFETATVPALMALDEISEFVQQQRKAK